MAVFVVSIGLSFSALDQIFGPQTAGSKAGMVFCLLSPMFYAFNYIQNEILIKRFHTPSVGPLRSNGDDLDNRDISLLLGLYNVVILGVYISIVTIPNWEVLMGAPMRKEGGTYFAVSLIFFSMIACCLIHNVSYIVLMGKLGSLSTGVMQGLRAITVFVGSALFFCDPETHPGQCFTIQKLVSSSIVIAGVVLFSVSQPKPTAKERDFEHPVSVE